MRSSRRSLNLALLVLILAAVLLEAAVFAGALGPGGPGSGFIGPSPPQRGSSGPASTGVLEVAGQISSLCLEPRVANQTGAYARENSILPLQNLSILVTEVSPSQEQTMIMTNASGIARANFSAGVYSVTISDQRVNRTVALRIAAGGSVLLNLSSNENWTPSSYFAYASASVLGQPLPWTNFTAVFPQFRNVSAGEDAALIFGALPRCGLASGGSSGRPEALVPLFSVESAPGGVRGTFAAPASLSSSFDQLTLVTYSSTYRIVTASG